MKGGRGNSGRGGQRRQRSGMHWIAATYAVVLVLDLLCLQQVAGLSACHEPPQVIRISRGQKITVEYWVGQNAVDGQQPQWKPDVDGAVTTDAPSREELTTVTLPAERATAAAAEKSSSTYAPPAVSSTAAATVKVNVTEEPDTTEQRPRATTTTTTPTPQAAETERVTSATSDVDQNINERSEREKTTEAPELLGSSTARPDSTTDYYRNDLADVTTSNGGPEVTVLIEQEEEEEAASSSTSDVTLDARKHEARELSTVYSDARQGASSSSSFDDGQTEIAYWATTPPPSSGEDNQVESRKVDGSDVTVTFEEPEVTELATERPSNLTFRSNNVTDDTTESSGRAEKSAEESTSTAAPLSDNVPLVDPNGNDTDSDVIDGRLADLNATTTSFEDESTTILAITDEPTEVQGKSVLGTISTTIRSILSTLEPSTAQEEVAGSDVTSLPSLDARSATDIASSSDVTELPEQNNTVVDKKTRGDIASEEEKEVINVTGFDSQNVTDSSSIAFEESTSGDESVTVVGRAATAETTDLAVGGVDNSTNSSATISGRAAETETESTTGSGGDSTETSDDATTTDVVILLNISDDALAGKSEPAVITEQKSEVESTETPTTSPVVDTRAQQEVDGGVTALGQSPEASGRPAEGARKFENPDVTINGDVSPDLAKRQEVGEESGFRSVVIVRNRKRKPFGARRNRKPNFVRHRPPYVTLDGRPPVFLRQTPTGDRTAYATDDVAQDRSDPSSQVFLLDADDQLDPMLQDASSAGSSYYAAPGGLDDGGVRFQQRSDLSPPPESRVHYVSVVRPPDGGLPVRDLRMSGGANKRRRILINRNKRSLDNSTATTNCQWVFRSDPGVPLLLTFKSFSTPETTDCRDHHISVERESNGFQSRWCGASGDRPGHAAFARSEINLQLFSVGDGSFPTGFSVEVQALDLKLLRKYAEVRRIIKG